MHTEIAIITVLILVLLLLIYKLRSQSENLSQIEDCSKLKVYVWNFGPGPTIGLISGVHGNEPSGSTLLTQLVEGQWQLPDELKRGTYKIIPIANMCGRLKNVRYKSTWRNRDLNRNFSEDGPLDGKAAEILNTLSFCDFVGDFHDGWSYNNLNKTSIGSTLAATTSKTERIANIAVNDVNKTISDPNKKFNCLHYENCAIQNTLSCYMRNRGRDYILTELSGQNNLQPLELCVSQAKIILLSMLKNYQKEWGLKNQTNQTNKTI
jgi:predicted deacylase